MKFGFVATRDAAGCYLTHRLGIGAKTLGKGHLLTDEDIAQLLAENIPHVSVASLDESDIHEDAAAFAIGGLFSHNSLARGRVSGGRLNLSAQCSGLLMVDRTRIDALNRVNESIAIATLGELAMARKGQIVATIKVIPFATDQRHIATCQKIVTATGVDKLLSILPFRPLKAVLLQTWRADTKESILAKTEALTAKRMADVGGSLISSHLCPHDIENVRQNLAAILDQRPDIILIAGASAVSDRLDVVPAAIERTGGKLDHFGMPVEPGNLLLLAHHDKTPIIVMPGCARSPLDNGFDWILQRIAADIPVSRFDITGMGVGGLLQEKFQSAEQDEALPAPGRPPMVAAIVLAAGLSRRMGQANKLLLRPEPDGPTLVEMSLVQLMRANIDSVIIVTGHEAEKIEAAIGNSAVLDEKFRQSLTFIHNENYADGIGTSIACGVRSLDPDIEGALITLGDMPFLTCDTISQLVAAFMTAPEGGIIRPVRNGRCGNPLLWSRAHYAKLAQLRGDQGGRQIIDACKDKIIPVDVADPGIHIDIDTDEDFTTLALKLV